MTFNEFIAIFYKWLVDIYPYDEIRVKHGGIIIPHKAWMSSISNVPREIFSKDSLDIILGKTAKRVLKVGGIEVDYIKYDSKELSDYRARYQNNEEVLIKYNPEDMGCIFVLHKINGEYFSVPAIDIEYADGLTYWQHKVLRRYSKEKMQLSNKESNNLHAAKVELNNLINTLVKGKKKKAATKAVAKFKGIATNNEKKKKQKHPDKNTILSTIKKPLRDFDNE